MSVRRRYAAVIVAATCAYSVRAHAHICMDKPVSRVGPSCNFASAQKPGPCGINTRSTQHVTTFKPGETITVEINETIDHPSHYRIAFNPGGDEFEDPANKDDKDGKKPFVLLDNIMDVSAAKQSVQVKLPDMTCDNCTLQLIQVMYDKGGNGFGNDDMYYSCADIVLKGSPSAGADAGSGGDAGSTSDAGASDPARPLPPDASTGIPPVDMGGGGMTGSVGGGGIAPPMQDAGKPPITVGDAGPLDAGGSTAGQGSTGGGHGHTAGGHEADEDEGSCSLRAGQRRDTGLALGASALAMLALAARRRRR